MVKLTIKTGVDGLEISFDPGDDREVCKEFMSLLNAVIGIFGDVLASDEEGRI